MSEIPDRLHGAPDPDGERAAAIAAAQRILEGPYVPVPRGLLLHLMATTREAMRLLEQVLQEGSGSTQLADDATIDEQAPE